MRLTGEPLVSAHTWHIQCHIILHLILALKNVLRFSVNICTCFNSYVDILCVLVLVFLDSDGGIVSRSFIPIVFCSNFFKIVLYNTDKGFLGK